MDDPANLLPSRDHIWRIPFAPKAKFQGLGLGYPGQWGGGKGQRPVDTEHPHPRGTLGGTPCPVLPLAARVVILIMGLR